MRRLLLLALASIIVAPSFASLAGATAPSASSNHKGLYISPLRTYTAASAGQTVTRSFRVANLTDKPMIIKTSLENFSVADYGYDYHFSQPKNDWLTFVEPSFTLPPRQGRDVAYTLTIPQNAPAGGQYYTLYASTDVSTPGFAGTVRAATLLYLTVNGPLIRTSQIVKSSLPRLVVSPNIAYSLDVKNTGNIHYFAYFNATVDGLFYHSPATGTSQLLMPGAIRHIEQVIKSPLVPGIYKVTYGYNPDQGSPLMRSGYILFVPPWFVVIVALVGAILIRILARRRAATDS